MLSADPAGSVRLEDGTRHKADLVVGADGLNSAVRDSLGMLKRKRDLIDGAIRLLIPRRASERTDPHYQRCIEYWRGPRRILYTPAGPDDVYLCLTSQASDEAAKRIPVDLDMWRPNFPRLADALDRVTDETPARWDRFSMVKVKAWSRGRVAILGDALHAQPPNLGQGAGLGMQGGLALAHALAQSPDVDLRAGAAGSGPSGRSWRTRSAGPGSGGCPRLRSPIRCSGLSSRFVSWVASRERVGRNVSRTAFHVPTGSVPIGG